MGVPLDPNTSQSVIHEWNVTNDWGHPLGSPSIGSGPAPTIINEDTKLPSGKYEGELLKDLGARYRIAICKKPRHKLGKLKRVQDFLMTEEGHLATVALYVCNWPIKKLEAVVVDVGSHKKKTIGGSSADYRRELLAKKDAKGRTKDLREKVFYLEQLKSSQAPSPPAAVAAYAYARAAPVTPTREGEADRYGGGGGMVTASLARVKKEEEGRSGRGRAPPRVRPIRFKKEKKGERWVYVPVKQEGKKRGSGQEGTSLARDLKKEEGGGGGGGEASSHAPPRKRMRVKKGEEGPFEWEAEDLF